MSACCQLKPAASTHNSNPQAQMITRQVEVRSTRSEVRIPKPGGHSLMAPPGPIPNPEVKHQHVDGSRTTGPARVDSCQGKWSPETEKVSGLHRLRAPARRYRPRAVWISSRAAGFRPGKARISFPINQRTPAHHSSGNKSASIYEF